MKKLPDWLIRAAKTFIQSFGGIVIPEICILLEGGFPESWPVAWAVISPFIAAGLAAGICSLWNIILEHMKEDK